MKDSIEDMVWRAQIAAKPLVDALNARMHHASKRADRLERLLNETRRAGDHERADRLDEVFSKAERHAHVARERLAHAAKAMTRLDYCRLAMKAVR